MNLKTLNTLTIIIGCIFLNIWSVNCDSEVKENILFRNQVYAILSQIPSEYNIVKQNNLGAKLDSNSQATNSEKVNSQRFVQMQAPDYYVAKAFDESYQVQKYEDIKGKNIFTSKYIYSHFSDSSTTNDNHLESVIAWNDDFRKQMNNKAEKKLTNGQQQNPTHQLTSDKETQQIIEQKSTELYNQFKNLETLKQKNLRQIVTDGLSNQKNQNLLKLIGFITIGLILSFAIVKKATKVEPALHQKNEEKTQLRLRDTVEDDDQQLSSSQSDD